MESFQLPSFDLPPLASSLRMGRAVQGILLTEDEGATYLSVFECTTEDWDNHYNRPSILKGAVHIETVTLDSSNTMYVFEVQSNDVTLYLSDLSSEGVDTCKVLQLDAFSGLCTSYTIEPLEEPHAFQSAMEHILEYSYEIVES
ncbi:hypothetical protein ACQR3P_28755 [Rhodococcus sp. IEGM1300]